MMKRRPGGYPRNRLENQNPVALNRSGWTPVPQVESELGQLSSDFSLFHVQQRITETQCGSTSPIDLEKKTTLYFFRWNKKKEK